MAAPKTPAGRGTGRGDKTEPKTAPRDYIVCREYTLDEFTDLLKEAGTEGKAPPFDSDSTVLVELGHTQARTPKEARRAVAKEKCTEEELAPEGDGVSLNAVPARALTSGRGVQKMRNEPKWDD